MIERHLCAFSSEGCSSIANGVEGRKRGGEIENRWTMGVENRLGQPWFACAICNTVDHNLSKSVL